jgi:hypothetical protein
VLLTKTRNNTRKQHPKPKHKKTTRTALRSLYSARLYSEDTFSRERTHSIGAQASYFSFFCVWHLVYLAFREGEREERERGGRGGGGLGRRIERMATGLVQ